MKKQFYIYDYGRGEMSKYRIQRSGVVKAAKCQALCVLHSASRHARCGRDRLANRRSLLTADPDR